jgi:hypothetical protein
MSDINRHFFRPGRRAAVALAAGAAALAVAGGGSAFAATSASPVPAPSKIVGHGTTVLTPRLQVAGPAVTLGPGGYSSGIVTCPTGTEVFGGGESNNAPGTLLLTDSWPNSNTSWLVYVKNTSTTGTYTFTPYAICR